MSTHLIFNSQIILNYNEENSIILISIGNRENKIYRKEIENG